MLLVFITPTPIKEQLYFNLIPSRSIVHCFLFIGFVHILIGAFRKQRKYESLRANAEFITLLFAALWIIIAVILGFGLGYQTTISGWNLLFDCLGSLIGIGTYKLLYRSTD